MEVSLNRDSYNNTNKMSNDTNRIILINSSSFMDHLNPISYSQCFSTNFTFIVGGRVFYDIKRFHSVEREKEVYVHSDGVNVHY